MSIASLAASPSTSPSPSSLFLHPITKIYPKLWFQIIPEPARFMTAAGFGNIIFFYIDAILYELIIHPLSLCGSYDDLVNGQCNALLEQEDGEGVGSTRRNSSSNTFLQKFIFKMFGLILRPLLSSSSASKSGSNHRRNMLEKNKESISFFLSYLIQIFAQHFLNAFFVYGLNSIGTKEKYFHTLLLTYSSYLVSLIGSTICNIALLKKGMSKNVAFWGTVLGFGMFNFVLLKILIGGDGASFATESDGSDDNDNSRNKRVKAMRNGRGNNNNNGNRKNRGNDLRTRRNKVISSKNSSSVTRKIRGGALHYFSYDNDSEHHNTIVSRVLNELMVGMRRDYDAQLMSFIKSVKSI